MQINCPECNSAFVSNVGAGSPYFAELRNFACLSCEREFMFWVRKTKPERSWPWTWIQHLGQPS
jgi:hypothetical protein